VPSVLSGACMTRSQEDTVADSQGLPHLPFAPARQLGQEPAGDFSGPPIVAGRAIGVILSSRRCSGCDVLLGPCQAHWADRTRGDRRKPAGPSLGDGVGRGERLGAVGEHHRDLHFDAVAALLDCARCIVDVASAPADSGRLTMERRLRDVGHLAAVERTFDWPRAAARPNRGRRRRASAATKAASSAFDSIARARNSSGRL
jgi:hypothetical protein